MSLPWEKMRSRKPLFIWQADVEPQQEKLIDDKHLRDQCQDLLARAQQ